MQLKIHNEGLVYLVSAIILTIIIIPFFIFLGIFFVILSIYDSPSLQKTSAGAYVKKKFPTNDLLEPVINKKQNKKIRIGYYSADFREHAMSSLLINLFELHNKSKFEIYGFSFGPKNEDEIKKRISLSFDKFLDVSLKSDKDIVRLSRELEIDISIDLLL